MLSPRIRQARRGESVWWGGEEGHASRAPRSSKGGLGAIKGKRERSCLQESSAM